MFLVLTLIFKYYQLIHCLPSSSFDLDRCEKDAVINHTHHRFLFAGIRRLFNRFLLQKNKQTS